MEGCGSPQTKASPRVGAEPQSDGDLLRLVLPTPAPNKPGPQFSARSSLVGRGRVAQPCACTRVHECTHAGTLPPLRESRAAPRRPAGQKFQGGWIHRTPAKPGTPSPLLSFRRKERCAHAGTTQKRARLCLGLKEQSQFPDEERDLAGGQGSCPPSGLPHRPRSKVVLHPQRQRGRFGQNAE